MTLSIIIPTYNRNKILCDTIQQILDQNYNDFELIIVDQSTQHDEYTTTYLASLPEKVKIIRSDNPNLPAARNLGIKESNGEIIVFIDDDMGIPKDTLSKICSTFDENKFISALTGKMIGVGNLAAYLFKKKLPKKFEKLDIIPVKHFLGGFMCFKKNVVSLIGGFDEWIGEQKTSAGEDLEFSLRLQQNGISLYLATRIVVEHIGKSTITGGYDKSSFTLDEKHRLQMRNNIYIQLKNRKVDNFVGSFLALWKVYRGAILNRSLLNKSIGKITQLHREYFSFCIEMHSKLLKVNK